MKLISIEPTPSPNSMKLTVNETLPIGKSVNFTQENKSEADGLLRELLDIDGVKGIYRVADFIALERLSKSEWESILSEVRRVFGEGPKQEEEGKEAKEHEEAYGEIRVFIQKFRDIPMQIKLLVDGEEVRVGLPERFMEAVMKAQAAADNNIILERKWEEQTPRYGEVEEIEKDLLDEISAAYSQERLNALVENAAQGGRHESPFHKVTLEMLDHPDWRDRYAVLDRMDPTVDDIPVLEKALHDEKVAIRRLATVYLGLLNDSQALPYLYEALQDKTVTVRRTAGDALSDLGDPAAIPAMIKALKDPSKIVRWRAAMFLYEVGDETAISALEEAQNDREFEVALQVKMALERIKGGEEAKGSVWKQMTEARRKN
ncbi:MAG: conserved virulence factor C family protein [Tuberibacillus sp.]